MTVCCFCADTGIFYLFLTGGKKICSIFFYRVFAGRIANHFLASLSVAFAL